MNSLELIIDLLRDSIEDLERGETEIAKIGILGAIRIAVITDKNQKKAAHDTTVQ